MFTSSRGATRNVVVFFLSVLAVGAASAGTIDVAWDPVTHPDLVGYRVYWGTSSGNYGPNPMDVGITTAAQISGLTECTTYYVAVKGRDSGGGVSTTYSNEIVGWPRPQVLGASPSTVNRNTTLNVTISGWNFQSGATVSFSDPAITVNTVSVNTCSEIVANVTIGASAGLGGVDVDVVNADTVFGAAASLITIAADQGAPTISSLQASNVGSTSATIGWTTNEPADGEVFYRKLGGTNYQSSSLDATLVTSHSVDLFGLMPSTTYEYYVASSDSSGNGATSSVQQFTTPSNGFSYMSFEAEAGPVTAPLQTATGSGSFQNEYLQVASGTPQGSTNNPAGTKDFGIDVPQAGNWNVWFRIQGSQTAKSWFWKANSGSFELVAPNASNTWEWVPGSQVTLTQGLNTITLGGRDAEARIDRVFVTDDPGFQPTEVPDADVAPPTSPGSLAADDTVGNQVTLTWNNPSNSDLSRIVVRYRTDGVSPVSPFDGFPLVDRAAVPGGAETVLHAGLTNGVTYSYSVFAIDAVGNVSAAATVAGTPTSAPVGEVTNVHRTDTTGSP